MVRIIPFDLLEIMRYLKSKSSGSLKWLETSLHAGIPPPLTITDALSGITNLTIDY